MSRKLRAENDCLNCEVQFVGQFCHECGQQNLPTKEHFWHFIGHSISHYFHFDSKFFETLIPLLTRPGQLTLDYFAGKRSKHLQPVSMYIFVSILYFLVVPKLEHREAVDKLSNLGQKNGNIVAEIDQELKKANDDKETPPTVTLDNHKALEHTLQDHIDLMSGESDKKAVTQTYEDYLKKQSLLPADQQDNYLERVIKHRNIELKKKTSHDWNLSKEVEHDQPKLYFILMPLLALILMFVFKSNKKYYVEHLVFTIHFMTAFFIFELIAKPLHYFVFEGRGLSSLFSLVTFCAVTWYCYRALRVFYQRSKKVTIFRMVGLSCLYLAAFLISYGIIYGVVYFVA